MKKQTVELQPMVHRGDYEGDYTIVHIVNNCQQGGEFTLCGCAIPDSSLESVDFAQSGEPYFGTVSQCTCQGCRDFVRYVQSMKWK